MSTRLLKCYGYCNNKYPKDELVKIGQKNFCKPCAEKKEKENKDRETLYKTIQTVYKIPFPSGQMLKQIKTFTEERNYTLEGLTKTICYFVKVKKQQPVYNAGLAFIPFHYDNAIKYYSDLEERRKNSQNINIAVKTISIKPRQYNNNEYLSKKLIKMEDILHDD